MSTAELNTVQNDCVVEMHYVLKDDAGNIIDQSDEHPLPYLHGHENIVPGLEAALTGAKVGDSKKVSVPAKDGYGEVDESMVLQVPRDQIPEEIAPEVGMTLGLESPDGHAIPARITEVTDESVTLDANHELAGMTLHFEVTISSVRPASEEELAHGHVHGPHGHHH